MGKANVYAVYFHPQAIEALGDIIKPYLSEGPVGQRVLCAEIDSGGPLFEMTLEGQSSDGREVELELMVPIAMVRCVVSVQGDDGSFGFS